MRYYNDTICLIFSPFFIKLGCYSIGWPCPVAKAAGGMGKFNPRFVVPRDTSSARLTS